MELAPQAANAAASNVVSRANMSEEEKARLKEEKKRRKELEKKQKAEKKAAAARAAAQALAARNALETVEYLSNANEPSQMFGSYSVIQSKCDAAGSGRTFSTFPQLLNLSTENGDTVWVRARVQKSVVAGQVAFLTLRKRLDTVQAVLVAKDMIKWAKKNLVAESIVDVFANVRVPDGGVVAKCTIGTIELSVIRIYIVSRADDTLPLTLEDAARPLTGDVAPGAAAASTENGTAEAETATSEDPQRPTVTRETRLDNRVVDMRVPPHSSILRIQSAVCLLFREYLNSQGFVEIHSPKLIAGSSEGGSDVFKLDYFGRESCLAQSPQLYKQMAICGDLQRVYEIGPVFRAEQSHTHRHLCEFTGLDLEMEIIEHYSEILDVLDGLFSWIFDNLEARFSRELEIVRSKWNVSAFKHYSGRKNLRLKWPEAIAMLREEGVEIGDFEDLNTEKEKMLGALVKEKYNTDFFMLTHFPSTIRPFYTMVDAVDSRYSNSYDLFMRGEEIVSGAQRIHDVELLKERATAMLGEAGVHSIQDYVDAFRYGAPPHGGAGIGLERVVMLYLGVGNIRECSMFPRDPNRLTP